MPTSQSLRTLHYNRIFIFRLLTLVMSFDWRKREGEGSWCLAVMGHSPADASTFRRMLFPDCFRTDRSGRNRPDLNAGNQIPGDARGFDTRGRFAPASRLGPHGAAKRPEDRGAPGRWVRSGVHRQGTRAVDLEVGDEAVVVAAHQRRGDDEVGAGPVAGDRDVPDHR